MSRILREMAERLTTEEKQALSALVKSSFDEGYNKGTLDGHPMASCFGDPWEDSWTFDELEELL